MKRRPVARVAGRGAGYPGVLNPEVRALVGRLAATTACLGAAGLIGLGLSACSSTGDKEVAGQQDAGDTYGSDVVPDASEVLTGQDLYSAEADAGDWTLLT